LPDKFTIAQDHSTPEIADKWLKYVAPLAADTARIQGTLGIQLDEALIVVDQPEQSRVVGRLNIAGIEMTSGPMADQIYGGIEQLRLLARSFSSRTDNPASNQTLITMPAQTVDFVVDHGIIQHNRMFFNIDRAEVITSGQVTMDGRLNIVAQVPLDARWLGSNLQDWPDNRSGYRSMEHYRGRALIPRASDR